MSTSKEDKIYHSPVFKSYVHKKGRFVFLLTLFFCFYYFSLPLLTSFFPKLQHMNVAMVSFIWIFALSQIVMTWIICHVYSQKAKSFDQEAEQLINQYDEDSSS